MIEAARFAVDGDEKGGGTLHPERRNVPAAACGAVGKWFRRHESKRAVWRSQVKTDFAWWRRRQGPTSGWSGACVEISLTLKGHSEPSGACEEIEM
jgi:hypothetical protein